MRGQNPRFTKKETKEASEDPEREGLAQGQTVAPW